MTDATIRFQYKTTYFEIYLDKLTGLPAPNLRKLFRYLLSEPWNNQAAIDAVEMFLSTQVKQSKGARQHWMRIYGYWNVTKQKINFK